jgi:CHAT domain-containing protein
MSREANDGEDGLLRIDEIYNVPLKAKMVFLSSCNTGSGKLLKGEGVLSVARGFLYAGSKSVVMSLWEIEDKSGTEIVSSFYKNLKKGYSKSRALRKAKLDYLESANQVRSQPYFWTALVVYGNNSPIYMSGWFIGALIIVVLLAIGIYFGRRMYS